MNLKLFTVASALALSGCAFPTQVRRFGVEYNEALASMANQQTMLNILRASKGMPTHFSSVSRFTGTLSMKASGSMNAQLRGSGVTGTSTTGNSLSTATTLGTSAAPAGVTTTNTVVTTPGLTSSIAEAVAEGVDLYTPQLGGELNSGTAFDVQVFDQQKFYQGILNSVSFDTVEMLLNQGFETDLVANLMIARVDLYEADGNGKKTGTAVANIRNEFSDRSRFQRVMDCVSLEVEEIPAKPTMIAPVSRLDVGTVKGTDRLTLAELALLDGEKLGLSDPTGIGADGSTDKTIYVVRPGKSARVPKLLDRSCKDMVNLNGPSISTNEGYYIGDGSALIGSIVGRKTVPVKKRVALEIVLRSPEAIMRAVGEIVRYSEGPEWQVPQIGICPSVGGSDCEGRAKKYERLFKIDPGRSRNALLETNFMGRNYSIPANGIRSMQIISIIQQLVNLQKESSERALSIPVRAVP